MNGLKKLNPKVLIIAAVILSLICAGLIYKYLKGKEAEAQRVAEANKKPTTRTVVVTTKDVEPGVTITNDMVKAERMDINATMPDAAITLSEVIGKELHNPIKAGKQITRRDIVKNVTTNFVTSIPNDKRAITISIDEIGSVAGFVKPGTRVDIISYAGRDGMRPASGKMVLQDVLVLAMGATDIGASQNNVANKKNQAEVPRTVTVAVDPRDAVMLRVVAQESKLTLALRPQKPSDDFVSGTRYDSQFIPVQSGMPAPVGGVPQAPVQVIRGTSVGK